MSPHFFILIFIGLQVMAATQYSLGGTLTERDCTPIDFSDRFGKVRDQGPANMCWAYATADLVGEALSLKPAEQLSVVQVISEAYLYEATNPAWYTKLFSFANNPHHDETSSPQIENLFRFATERTLFANQGIAGQISIPVMLTRNEFCIEEELPARPMDTLLGVQSNAFFEVLKLSGVRTRDQIISWMEKKPSNQSIASARVSLKEKIRSICTRRFAGKPMKVLEKRIMSEDAHMTLPDFQDKILQRERPFFLSTKFCFTNACATKDRPDRHAVIVVGREWDPSARHCRLKMRNSWGTDCSQYNKKVKCNDAGYLSVSIDDLANGKDWTDLLWIEAESML